MFHCGRTDGVPGGNQFFLINQFVTKMNVARFQESLSGIKWNAAVGTHKQQDVGFYGQGPTMPTIVQTQNS